MEKLRFDFAAKTSVDGKSNIVCITSIGTPDGHIFAIPVEYQPASLHQAVTIESEWNKWEKTSVTHLQKGWSPIRYALAFKYQTGSLLDYALKEKLLLEVRKSIDTGTLIDLIALGLPNYLTDKIDRETLQETEDLYNELGRLQHLVGRNKYENKNYTYSDTKNKKIEEKKPCQICITEKKGKRFHPEENCWFKQKNQSSGDFIKLMNNVTQNYNIDLVLTDQYPGINSKEFKDFLKNKNITIVFTAVDAPFSNGLNERLNQTLVNRIRNGSPLEILHVPAPGWDAENLIFRHRCRRCKHFPGNGEKFNFFDIAFESSPRRGNLSPPRRLDKGLRADVLMCSAMHEIVCSISLDLKLIGQFARGRLQTQYFSVRILSSQPLSHRLHCCVFRRHMKRQPAGLSGQNNWYKMHPLCTNRNQEQEMKHSHEHQTNFA
ncbi:hypothetical protein EVAR_57605_1 [Eumeta japonica]|uniref:Integrase catalytic domain-containing protein n=1 Tax=Eumeta variegata TaxID=151549 RepID=A0A4C1Y143_EUMVA|nr:hypothetical protein EVAR_57605_1 [Eumeta japonica]